MAVLAFRSWKGSNANEINYSYFYGCYSLRLMRVTGHGGACLPVLEREQCECLKSLSNSHRLL